MTPLPQFSIVFTVMLFCTLLVVMLSIPHQTHIFRFDIFDERFWEEIEVDELFPDQSTVYAAIVSVDDGNNIYWNGEVKTLVQIQELANPTNPLPNTGVSFSTLLSLSMPYKRNTIRFKASQGASYLVVHRTLATLKIAGVSFLRFEDIGQYSDFSKAAGLPNHAEHVGETFIPPTDRRNIIH